MQLSPEEREKMIATWISAGFNVEGLHEYANKTPYLPEDLQKHRELGMQPLRGLPVNRKNSGMTTQFPDAQQYLKDFPQYRAKTKSGDFSNVVICHTHLLDKDGTYRPRMQQWLGQQAKEHPFLLWDYEVPPDTPNSFCYCERCMNAFQTYAQSSLVSVESLTGALGDKWIDYQCYRMAELVGVLNGIIKTANVNTKLMVYSGYQSELTRNRYGVDWTYLAPHIDAAMCGYGRPTKYIKATLSALNGKPLIGSEIIVTWLNRPDYPLAEVTTNLFRRITDCGGGIMIFNDFTYDGRYLYAVNRIASIVADYEDFFLTFSRSDDLAKAMGVVPDDIVVLVNKAGARLVFCFNQSAATKDFVLVNQHLLAGMTGYSIETKKHFSDPSAMSVSVPPKDVRTFYIGVEK